MPTINPARPVANIAYAGTGISGISNLAENKKIKATPNIEAQLPVYVLGSTSIFFIINSSLPESNWS